MNLAYGDADPNRSVRRALIELYQTNKKFKTFWAEFHRLAQKAEITPESTLEYLKDVLRSSKIKRRILCIEIRRVGQESERGSMVFEACKPSETISKRSETMRKPSEIICKPSETIHKPSELFRMYIIPLMS